MLCECVGFLIFSHDVAHPSVWYVPNAHFATIPSRLAGDPIEITAARRNVIEMEQSRVDRRQDRNENPFPVEQRQACDVPTVEAQDVERVEAAILVETAAH
jgi:hypothetical protein